MSDLISRQAAIDALHMHLMYRMGTDSNKKRLDEWINNLPSAQPEIVRCKDCKLFGNSEQLPSAQPEQLTDAEQRIFLKAIEREEKVCKKVDEEWGSGDEECEINLVHACHEIIRKVKGELWT